MTNQSLRCFLMPLSLTCERPIVGFPARRLLLVQRPEELNAAPSRRFQLCSVHGDNSAPGSCSSRSTKLLLPSPSPLLPVSEVPVLFSLHLKVSDPQNKHSQSSSQVHHVQFPTEVRGQRSGLAIVTQSESLCRGRSCCFCSCCSEPRSCRRSCV